MNKYSDLICSKFALEGLTKSVNRELNPKWNIKLMIASPGGVDTNFATALKQFPRHPAYDNDEAPLTSLLKYVSDPSVPASWASPDKCAAVICDAVLGQKERPLPMRLNLGADTLPLMREDVKQYLKEMEVWESETLKVAPSADSGKAIRNVELLMRES